MDLHRHQHRNTGELKAGGILLPAAVHDASSPALQTPACTPPNLQASVPCFADPATTPDMTAGRLEIAPGLLPAGASHLYKIGLQAAKGSRGDSDAATIRVLEGAAPTGTIR